MLERLFCWLARRIRKPIYHLTLSEYYECGHVTRLHTTSYFDACSAAYAAAALIENLIDDSCGLNYRLVGDRDEIVVPLLDSLCKDVFDTKYARRQYEFRNEHMYSMYATCKIEYDGRGVQ